MRSLVHITSLIIHGLSASGTVALSGRFIEEIGSDWTQRALHDVPVVQNVSWPVSVTLDKAIYRGGGGQPGRMLMVVGRHQTD